MPGRGNVCGPVMGPWRKGSVSSWPWTTNSQHLSIEDGDSRKAINHGSNISIVSPSG